MSWPKIMLFENRGLRYLVAKIKAECDRPIERSCELIRELILASTHREDLADSLADSIKNLPTEENRRNHIALITSLVEKHVEEFDQEFASLIGDNFEITFDFSS